MKTASFLPMKDLLSLSGRRILGVNPPVRDFAFFDLWSKPLGLLYLLERVRRGGCETALLDMVCAAASGERSFGRRKIASFELERPAVLKGIPRRYRHFGLSEADVAARLSDMPKPDLIFLTSAMTYWYPGVIWAIRALNNALPGVPIILGGIYARLCPEHAAKTGADFVVTEGWSPDVERPAMDLYGELSYGVTATSFGCPLSCRYCASRRLWPDYRRRPIKEVLSEIDFQFMLGAEDFAFYDDALLMDKDRYFYPLCEALRSGYGGSVRFHTPNGLHVREIDHLCAETLMGANFRTIRLSLESIDPKVINDGSGKVVRSEYESAVRCLLAAGYGHNELETYILLGLPGQSVESVKDTISFVRDVGAKPKLAEFSPIPGTPVFEEAAARLPQLRAEPLLHNNSVYSSWISGDIAPETLQELKDFAKRAL